MPAAVTLATAAGISHQEKFSFFRSSQANLQHPENGFLHHIAGMTDMKKPPVPD